MYTQLLAGIFEEAEKRSEQEQQAYLQSLKPVLEKMHQAYLKQNVVVDYTASDSQACYLLRYFPVYSQLIKKVLLEIPREAITSALILSDAHTIRAMFIGPGPCPEVAGFASLLKEANSKKYLTAHLFDKYDWRYARSILRTNVLPTQSAGRCDLFEHHADLLDAGFAESVSEEASQTDFIIFQNCLNEVLFRDVSIVEKNIIKVVERLKREKLIILIDRVGYPAITSLLQRIEKTVTATGIGEIVLSVNNIPPRFDGVSFSHKAMPSSLYDTGMLFDNDSNGRKPTRFVDYIRSVIRKI